MSNLNLNYKIIPIGDSVKNPITTAATMVTDSFYNSGYTCMTLEVSGTAAVGKVFGCTNTLNPDGTEKPADECSWTELALINMKDFDMPASFSAGNKYSIGINGISRVRLQINGSVDATFVAVLGM